MNREIKFRGKRRDNGEWIYGLFLRGVFGDAVVQVDNGFKTTILVDEESLGQYTGLKDRNGKEIYEGDIIKGISGIVVYACWDIERSGFFYKDNNGNVFVFGGGESAEIIGNIHDNPELITVPNPGN